MNLLGPIQTPLRAFAFALGGALLAWSWFNLGPIVPVAVVLLGWLGTVLLQMYADSLVATRPRTALSLFEFRLLGIVIASAGAAALVIILTVSFTLDKEVEAALASSTKEVIAAVAASLTSFVGAIAMSAEKIDDSIGDLVKKKFRAKFVVGEAPKAGQVEIDLTEPEGRRADKALNTSNDFGWTDWSRDNRVSRVDAIATYLEKK